MARFCQHLLIRSSTLFCQSHSFSIQLVSDQKIVHLYYASISLISPVSASQPATPQRSNTSHVYTTSFSGLAVASLSIPSCFMPYSWQQKDSRMIESSIMLQGFCFFLRSFYSACYKWFIGTSFC